MTPHLLAALPLAVALGLRLAGRPGLAAVIGVGVAAVGVVVHPALDDLLDVTGAGLVTRATARTAACLVALLPWAAAAAGLVPAARRPVPPGLVLAACAAVALLLPPLAADREATRELAAARAALGRDRPAAARTHVAAAARLTPDRRLPGTDSPLSLLGVLRELDASLARLTAAAEAPLSPTATMTERYDRAGVLLALGRPAEVGPLLDGQAAGSPRSRLRIAEAAAELGDWATAADQCRAAADAAKAFADRDPRAAAVRREALDGLADALAGRDDRAGVEAALREGAETLPAFAGHFRLRLGVHYRGVGRPLVALDELRAAVRLDPSLDGQAAAIERVIREQTPGCLVGR